MMIGWNFELTVIGTQRRAEQIQQTAVAVGCGHVCRSAFVSIIQKVLEKWLNDERHMFSQHEERIYRYTIASTWFVFTLVMALVIPDIGVVIPVLGAVAAAFMFLFPGQSFKKVLFRCIL